MNAKQRFNLAKRHSGEVIQRARRRHGWTQVELCAEIIRHVRRDEDLRDVPEDRRRHLDPSIISHWENGRHAVSYRWRRYLAAALDRSLDDLFSTPHGDIDALEREIDERRDDEGEAA